MINIWRYNNNGEGEVVVPVVMVIYAYVRHILQLTIAWNADWALAFKLLRADEDKWFAGRSVQF